MREESSAVCSSSRSQIFGKGFSLLKAQLGVQGAQGAQRVVRKFQRDAQSKENKRRALKHAAFPRPQRQQSRIQRKQPKSNPQLSGEGAGLLRKQPFRELNRQHQQSGSGEAEPNPPPGQPIPPGKGTGGGGHQQEDQTEGIPPRKPDRRLSAVPEGVQRIHPPC